ncbi:unnamed protein product [Merluccius merluccius]
MIGSPDLLAFTGGEGFGEEDAADPHDMPPLPVELSVPLEPPSNPWTTAARFHRDFILVAEFSEQVGPQPLMTIPDDPQVLGSFDLNHFSVRIMSVDYQAPFPAAAAPASATYPGPRINFAEDSRVVLGDSADSAFAYVQHMTLYDLEARGFVRPFCMAYVSSDRRKLMEHFGELSAGFTQASDSLKTGNRRAFANELQRKLQELEYTRLTRQQGAEHQNAADELEALDRSILNYQDLLRQVMAYPNRKLNRPGFLPYDPADSLADPCASLPPASAYPSSSSCVSPTTRRERRLKTLEELSDAYFLGVTVEQLTDTEHRLRGDRSALHSACLIRDLSRRLPLTNFLFELWRPEEGEKEQEEEEEEEKMPWPSLDCFFSCVEELPIKLEVEGRRTPPTPDPEEGGVAEMTGSVSSGDSIEVLGTERSYRTQHAVMGDDHHRGTPPPPPAMALKSLTLYEKGRRARAYACRANSEDSIEVLSITDSIVPEDLQAITEEDPEVGLNDMGEKIIMIIFDRCCDLRYDSLLVVEEKAVASVHSTSSSCQRGESVTAASDLRVKFSFSLPMTGACSPSCTPVRSLSMDEVSESTSSSKSPSQTYSLHVNRRLDQKKRRKAGLRALRFVQQHSFYQHAVFCLLSGRPLIVIGGDESGVKKLVSALALFLPGPGLDGTAVLPCLATPLQLTDLLTWRLIGLHRTSSAASMAVLRSLARYSRYLALLDMDQRTLRCPAYSGSLIGRIVHCHSSICRGSTYLLHLESCLTALANQALLYTFHPALRRDGVDVARGEALLLERGFCSSEDDLRVMRFLSDLIKQYNAGCGPPILSVSYRQMQIHKHMSAT